MTQAAGYPGVFSSQILGSSGLPTDYITDQKGSYFTASQVQIATGKSRDDTDTDDIVVAATLTVDISTTGANGRNSDTAEQASKWYSMNVIKNPTSGVVAGFLINEDDIGGFTFPAGYTLKRHIGWIRNNGASNLRRGRYYGKGRYRVWIYNETRNNVTALLNGGVTLPAYGTVDCSEWIPPSSQRGKFIASLDPTFGATQCDFRANGTSQTNNSTHMFTADEVTNHFEIDTDSSQQIQYGVGIAGDLLDLYVMGFIEEV
jgi:hypothetical protein